MNMTIREATTADAEAACIALRRSITECCVEDHRNEPEALSIWLRNKTPETMAGWFATPENFSVVATSTEQVIGVGLLTAKGELALCYVLPEARYQGVGKSLLNAMESHAMQLGVTEIFLSSIGTAKSFYLQVLHRMVRLKQNSVFKLSLLLNGLASTIGSKGHLR